MNDKPTVLVLIKSTEQKFSKFLAQFLKVNQFYAKTVRTIFLLSNRILLVFFVLKLDHLLETYDQPAIEK